MRRLLLVVVAGASLWAAPGAFAAGWCGSGEVSADRADVVTGRQVHAVWAVPSDGADTFATGAPMIADDLAAMESWWQGQDASRVPRLDLATFPAGACADISFVRLPRAAAEYNGAGAAFNAMSLDVAGAGLSNPYKKYVVYYDGPSVQANVCGTGGGEFDVGPAYAFVWVHGCPSVHTDNVATHELLHALGAVPTGAPHDCPPPNEGHPCDSTQDILYPFNNGLPLAQEILDVGRDDYYGHGGSWPDIQDSLWLHLLLPPLPLTVTFSGNPGAVVSDVPGVSCTATCTTQWDPGSSFTLVANPPAGSRLVHWQGACTGPLDCAIPSMTAPVNVTAVFGPSRIPVRVATTGRGRIRCTPACSASFVAGNDLTLRSIPAARWKFSRWSGACAGTRAVCRPKTDYAVTARATFRRR